MTAQELRQYINDIINIRGVEAKLTDHLVVDPVTYANICQHIFDHHQQAIRYANKFGAVRLKIL